MILNCSCLNYINTTTFNWTSALSKNYQGTESYIDISFYHQQGNITFSFFVNSKSNFIISDDLFTNDSFYSVTESSYVLFTSEANIDADATLVNCSLIWLSVKSNIICLSTFCAVTQIQQSVFDCQSSSLISLSLTSVWQDFWIFWADAAGLFLHPYSTTLTELFIQNRSLTAAISAQGHRYSYVNLSTLSAEVFSTQLSLLWNTYWQCSVALWYQISNLLSNLTAFSNSANTADLIINATTASITYLQTVYICNYLWAVVLLIVSLVLFICVIYSAILKYQTVTSDILGYVSSLMRDNLYVSLLSGGTALNDLERARLLRNIKVRL